MRISDQATVIHVAHEVLDRIEGAPESRNIMHRKYDAGRDHDHQHDAGERSEIPKIVQISWRRVFVKFVLHTSENRQPKIDPANDRIRKFWPACYVIFRT